MYLSDKCLVSPHHVLLSSSCPIESPTVCYTIYIVDTFGLMVHKVHEKEIMDGYSVYHVGDFTALFRVNVMFNCLVERIVIGRYKKQK